MLSATPLKPGLAPRVGWVVRENSASSTATASVCLDGASMSQPLSANHPVIVGMAANPYPYEVVSILFREGAVGTTHSNGPVSANPLEPERGMLRILSETLKVSPGDSLG